MCVRPLPPGGVVFKGGVTAFEKMHRGRLGKCWVNVSFSTAFAHRVDDQRGVSMVSSAHFPSDPFVLHLGMCLLEEASCCVLVVWHHP